MKLKFLFAPVLAATIFFPLHLSPAYAEDTVCSGVAVIDVSGELERRPDKLQCILQNYLSTPGVLNRQCNVNIRTPLLRNESELQFYCLNFGESSFSLIEPLIIEPRSENDVHIIGLRLAKDGSFTSTEPLLTIANTGAFSSKVIVSNSAVDCVNQLNVGVSVLASNTIIKSTEVSNCSEAIKIGSATTAANNAFLGALDASTYEIDKNTLTANAIGIHQISGGGNRWPYNSISGGNGIVVEGGTRPALQVGEGDIATLECEQTEGEATVSSCAMQFISLPEAAGEVEVYKTLRISPVEGQGKDYMAKCSVEEGTGCVFDAANSSALISNIMCGTEKCDFTALFTGESSSMYVSAPFKIDANIATIVMPTTEMPIGGTAGLDGGAETGGGENYELYIESTDSGNILGTEQRGGGTGGQQKTVGVSISPKACKFASTDNTRAKGIFETWWWVIFTLPLPYFMRRREKYR